MQPKFPEDAVEKFSAFKKLRTPSQVQDFLDSIPINFEEEKETCRSPLMVLQHKKAHCMEGAMFAAAAFWYHGARPLLLDLKTTDDDFDHVVALFKHKGRWGTVSKTNHAILRYRDPVYVSVHELVMSYFHEYFLDSGVKTLRSYSTPFDLAKFGDGWFTAKKNVWHIAEALDSSPHFKILGPMMARTLRLAHPLEREAGKLVERKTPAQGADGKKQYFQRNISLLAQRKSIEPISKVGRWGLRELFEREARSSDREYSCISWRKSLLRSRKEPQDPRTLLHKLFLRWVLSSKIKMRRPIMKTQRRSCGALNFLTHENSRYLSDN